MLPGVEVVAGRAGARDAVQRVMRLLPVREKKKFAVSFVVEARQADRRGPPLSRVLYALHLILVSWVYFSASDFPVKRVCAMVETPSTLAVHRCRFVDFTPSAVTALAFPPLPLPSVKGKKAATSQVFPGFGPLAVGRANGNIELCEWTGSNPRSQAPQAWVVRKVRYEVWKTCTRSYLHSCITDINWTIPLKS